MASRSSTKSLENTMSGKILMPILALAKEANDIGQATTDAPCANFADELIAAYPNAKVVLSTRDPDAWVVSMEASYYRILAWKPFRFLAAIDAVRPY